MEFLNPAIPKSSWIFSNTSFFTSLHSLSTSSKKRALRFRISKSPHAPLTLSTPQAFQVSARFGRPTSRRNSLRKKLLEDQKVRQNPIPLDTSSDFGSFDNINNFQESLNYGSQSPRENGVAAGEARRSVQNVEMKSFGGSLLLTKLENWVDQYKKDAEFWGIGSGPIFRVLQDLEGKVKQVTVNEDEILQRGEDGGHEFGALSKVNSKILYAKDLARQMEKGENVIPRNSSVAKFVVAGEESKLVNAVHGMILGPDFIPRLSKVGSLVLSGVAVLWTVKKLFSFQNKKAKYTKLKKEMMRRKIKSRKEKEMEKGSVEVIQESSKPPNEYFQKPKLDKQELMNNILKVKAAKDAVILPDSSNTHASKSTDFDDKIQEIRVMASQVREIEGRDQSLAGKDEKEVQTMDEGFPNEMEMIKKVGKEDASFPNSLLDGKAGSTTDEKSLLEPGGADVQFQNGEASLENRVRQGFVTSSMEVLEDMQSTTDDLKDAEGNLPSMVKRGVIHSSDTIDAESCLVKNESTFVKPRVILSVKEAREFLSTKCDNQELKQAPLITAGEENLSNLGLPGDEDAVIILEADNQGFQSAITGGASEPAPSTNDCRNSSLKDEEPITMKNDIEDSNKGHRADFGKNPTVSHEGNGISTEKESEMDNWMEKNFHEVEPVLKKIGDGFRDNYLLAREKVVENLNRSMGISQLGLNEDGSELEWMKDDRLREIVFQVRENELAGRDPFYLLDAEDKLAFFRGLEKKVEKENDKLSHLHEWLHSNIENLDYGADGISLYDPPEKVVPRWKGPPLEKSPEFLDNFQEQRKALFSGKAGVPCPTNKDGEHFLQKPIDDQNSAKASADPGLLRESYMKDPKYSKTVIEGSDGSLRHGKKSGKEYWQHTKKWSRGFLESYKSETDPETKSIMKDIGKDLDRWITEKEIEEAKDLMTKIPEKQKKFIEKELNKLRREMELFGPQAVVSKYREYAEDKEEDFLWWLDLPHVLCIELYTTQSEEQRIGFYALEMAADLELEPKPHHVIAFEDAGDCRNLCYIIQAHLEMLGNGHAFVVPRPPKDAFREAKANGCGVTVIRKGELKLNVDQTLEEVEEEICEIGSKMYHDKIMQERSVDVNTLIKGVIRSTKKPNKPPKRKRLKKVLKRGTKKQS